MGFLDRLFGRLPPEQPVSSLPAPPTDADLQAAVVGIHEQIAGKVPPTVAARVTRITETVSATIPRLGELGPGSAQAHSVVATATSYLPEALGAYLRLPRSFADRRPIDNGRTALMVLTDQPNCCCNGTMITPGAERTPIAHSAERNITASTTQA